jgi:hypothetical protein
MRRDETSRCLEEEEADCNWKASGWIAVNQQRDMGSELLPLLLSSILL